MMMLVRITCNTTEARTGHDVFRKDGLFFSSFCIKHTVSAIRCAIQSHKFTTVSVNDRLTVSWALTRALSFDVSSFELKR